MSKDIKPITKEEMEESLNSKEAIAFDEAMQKTRERAYIEAIDKKKKEGKIWKD